MKTTKCKKGHALDMGGLCPSCDYNIKMNIGVDLYQAGHLLECLKLMEKAGCCIDVKMHNEVKETLKKFVEGHPLHIRGHRFKEKQ